MPAKSAKQYRFMQMIAHGGKSKMTDKAKSAIGPSEAVAKEFIDKTPKKKRSSFMKSMKDKKDKKEKK